MASGSERRALAALRLHAQVGLVPAMSAEEREALQADIAERGIQVPLEVTQAGIVLDGRHRLEAAGELGLAQVPVRVVSPADEVDYIVRAALSRRHLTPSQKAALAVEREAYERATAAARERSKANLARCAERATLPTSRGRPREQAAALVGVSARTVEDAATVRAADAALFAKVKAGELPAHRAACEVRRRRRKAALAAPRLPSGLFDLIYADPPWRSQVPASEWAPEAHYPTMTIEEICALPVPAAKDALLFLWVPNALLPQSLRVMEAWGFAYRTNAAWVKPSIGLGHWLRNRHELLLLGRRGSFPPPEEADRPGSVLEAKRGRHSEKPEQAYELIECMYPRASKLELFARGRPREGWAAWGNEVEAA